MNTDKWTKESFDGYAIEQWLRDEKINDKLAYFAVLLDAVGEDWNEHSFRQKFAYEIYDERNKRCNFSEYDHRRHGNDKGDWGEAEIDARTETFRFIERLLRDYAHEVGVPYSSFIQLLRVAVTGRSYGDEHVYMTLHSLGRKETQNRIALALAVVKERRQANDTRSLEDKKGAAQQNEQSTLHSSPGGFRWQRTT